MYQHLQGYYTISLVKSMGSTLTISHSASNAKFFISSKLIQIEEKSQPGDLQGNLIAYPTCTCVNFVQYPPLSFERITGKGGKKPTLFIFARVKQGGSIKVRTRCPKVNKQSMLTSMLSGHKNEYNHKIMHGLQLSSLRCFSTNLRFVSCPFSCSGANSSSSPAVK